MSLDSTIRLYFWVVFLLFAAYPFTGHAYTLGAFDVRFLASLQELFDDNITSLKESKKQDYVTVTHVGMEALYEGEKRNFTLSGNIRQNTFLDNHNFNNIDQDFTATFGSELSKYDRLSLSNTFSRSEEPRSFEDAFGSTSGRYRIQKNKFSLGYARDITSQYEFRARYTNAFDSYSRQDLADSFFNSVGLELGYLASSWLSFLCSYDFAHRDFNPGNHALNHTLGVGARIYLTPQLSLDSNAGINFVTSYDRSRHRPPILGMSLTGELDKNTRAALSFTKRYDINAYSQDLFGYWQTSAGLRRALTERLEVDCSLFYGQGEYKSLGLRDKFAGVSLGAHYDLKDNIRGTAAYSHTNLTSNIFSREYKKNVISIGFTIKF